jgi:hypothetical protein
MPGKIIETTIPHGCDGYLIGVINGSSAIVLCNKCMALMRRLPRKEGLWQALHELELDLALAVRACDHCGWVSLIAGEAEVFLCQRCCLATLWSKESEELFYFGCQIHLTLRQEELGIRGMLEGTPEDGF